MMNIETLKSEILNKKLSDNFFIFLYSDNIFLCQQYLHEIQNLLNLQLDVYDSESDVPKSDMFSNGNLSVLYVDKLETVFPIQNYIIITKKISDEVEKLYNNNIIKFPKLENWQIRDYAYSNLQGINSKKIDWLLENSAYNIFRIQAEIDKLSCVSVGNKDFIFDRMIEENAFGDISNRTIYDLTNAIQSKDFSTIIGILKKLDVIDIEPIGLITVLYKMFEKNILVWFNPCPTPENTGISNPKQIYAINKSGGKFSKESIINIFEFLTIIDLKVKTGEIPMNILIDYLICKMFVL